MTSSFILLVLPNVAFTASIDPSTGWLSSWTDLLIAPLATNEILKYYIEVAANNKQKYIPLSLPHNLIFPSFDKLNLKNPEVLPVYPLALI